MTQSVGHTQCYTTTLINTSHIVAHTSHAHLRSPQSHPKYTHSPTVTEVHTPTMSQCHIVTPTHTVTPSPWSYRHTTLRDSLTCAHKSHTVIHITHHNATSHSHTGTLWHMSPHTIPQSHKPTASHGLMAIIAIESHTFPQFPPPVSSFALKCGEYLYVRGGDLETQSQLPVPSPPCNTNNSRTSIILLTFLSTYSLGTVR